jgi:hypothetical protein
MKNFPLASILGLTLLAASGCGGDDTGSDSGNPIVGGNHPQQTEWKKVVDNLPFPISGEDPITSISIGRLDYDNNFANRGNVEVYLDQDAEVISVEVRYYDFSDDITAQGDDTVEGTFERMSLWAYVSSGNPSKPSDMKPEDDCTVGTWKSGCSVTVYYDGQTQPVRAGADIRVHLPKGYRGELNVTTEDNNGESSFPRVGNVTIDGICGSGDINLAQGTAKVKLCRDLTPAPTCTAQQIDDCANYKDEMGENAAWSSLCPCSAENFGQLKIEALKPWAGNITVDIPTTTWLNANLSNEETDKPHPCMPVLESCTEENKCTLTNDDGYSVSGEFNYPSTAAASGAGFNLTVKSAGCNPVSFFPDDSRWNADETMSKPTVEEHGHIKVCTDCL